MKALVCEMCGGSEFLKQDGLFVCQHCHTKYSPEEAKKMMIEGTVAVTGTVKVDRSEKLNNLYQIARRAKDDNNGENAAKYYDLVLQEDPTSWEASFYVVYFKAMGCTIAQIRESANKVMNCLDTVLELIQAHVEDQEQSKAYAEVAARLNTVSTMLYQAANNHYQGIDINIRSNYKQELINNTLASCDILYIFGNRLEKRFGRRKDAQQLAVAAWARAIDMHNGVLYFIANKDDQKTFMDSYAAKIRKYNPSYEKPAPIKTTGCYIATAVYGSYDCPQVWTLRRYRDGVLARSWAGRAFIRAYYALSPAMVRRFGRSAWFQRLWRGVLNRMVAALQARGFADSPYQDRI